MDNSFHWPLLDRPMSQNDDETKSELIQGLKSVLSTVRTKSARGLAKFGPHARIAIGDLFELTSDPEQGVREAAVQAIGSIGRETVPLLIQLLSNPCKYVRRNAVWSLGKLGPDAVQSVRPLCNILNDPDARTAGGAVQALGAIGRLAVEAVPSLAETMRGTNVVLCRLASKSLSQIGSPALATLVTHLKHHDPFVRGEAAVALGWMGAAASPAVPVLTDLLIGHTNVTPPKHQSGFGGSDAVTPIAIMAPQTNATSETTLLLVIQALGRIGTASVVAERHLLDLTTDSRETISQAAAEAIRMIREG